MTEENIYIRTIKQLISAGISSPRLEARLLIGFAAEMDADEVSAATALNQSQQQKLEQVLKQRLNHCPLDKIFGWKEFYKYPFKVNADVLSPRPDTEILVLTAADIIKNNPISTILDFGTGSGCILLSLLKEFPFLNGTGVDKSAQALATAADNCRLLGVENRCRLILADWFSSKIMLINQTFDLIVSNPPYIPSREIVDLDAEVRNHDPIAALDGGLDGLESYRCLAQIMPQFLNPDGFVIVEIGIGQSSDVIKVFQQNHFIHCQTLKDLAGIERCIIFRKKHCN